MVPPFLTIIKSSQGQVAKKVLSLPSSLGQLKMRPVKQQLAAGERHACWTSPSNHKESGKRLTWRIPCICNHCPWKDQNKMFFFFMKNIYSTLQMARSRNKQSHPLLTPHRWSVWLFWEQWDQIPAENWSISKTLVLMMANNIGSEVVDGNVYVWYMCMVI